MSKKLILIILLILAVTVVLSYLNSNRDKIGILTSPGFLRQNPKVTPAPQIISEPPQAPKTFQFDSSADLKAELEKINPQILDSDFKDL